MKKKKTLKILLCMIMIFSVLLTSVAMAYPDENLVPDKHNPISLTGVDNARDLGGWETEDGYEIKDGLLLRSGNLSKADAQEIRDLGVTKIIDLRTSLEKLRKPNVEVEGVEQIGISMLTIPNLFVLESEDWFVILHALRSGIMETWFANLYRQYIQDPKAIEATQQFFDEVLENAQAENGPAPILWHCTAGKDRTGIEAMLLMAALGCDEETIKAEFLQTRAYYIEQAEASWDKAYSITHIKRIADEFYKYETVTEDYFDISWNIIKRDYGDVDNYLEEAIELTDDEINILKEAYLEEPAA